MGNSSLKLSLGWKHSIRQFLAMTPKILMRCLLREHSRVTFPTMWCPVVHQTLYLENTYYVMCNPKDVFVSYHVHASSVHAIPCQERDAYFKQWGSQLWKVFWPRLQLVGPQRWWYNVLIVKYEDMKRDLPSAVATIAKFIGQDISVHLVEEILQS